MSIKGDEEFAAIASAIEAGDHDRIKNLAHTMKSASRSVGAMALGELCQKVEHAAREARLDDCRSYRDELLASYQTGKVKKLRIFSHNELIFHNNFG